jgi:hypothetical protein
MIWTDMNNDIKFEGTLNKAIEDRNYKFINMTKFDFVCKLRPKRIT